MLLSCSEAGYQAGKQFGGIYTDDKALKQTLSEAMVLFQDSNALYPTIFPGNSLQSREASAQFTRFAALRKMETEVVKMTVSLLHGVSGETCGTMTTGGSESIIMSILAHKKWAAAERGIVAPEAVVPRSAHAAFAKGCAYFDVKMIVAPLDANFRVDVAAVRKLVTRNTVLIVGSAPTFPQVCFVFDSTSFLNCVCGRA